MAELVFDPGEEPDLYHYWAELDYYPRDEEFIPDWLRQKLEQWEAERAPAFNRRIAELEEDFYVLTHGPRGSQTEPIPLGANDQCLPEILKERE